METLPATQSQQLATVRGLLEKLKPQLLMVLGEQKHVDIMARMAMTCVQRNPALLSCTPHSLMGAVMQAAQLGLEPDDVRGLSYIIPYGRIATLVPGYRGLLSLALATPGVTDIYARLVHAADKFSISYGTAEALQHEPAHGSERGDVIGGYYVIRFAHGVRFEMVWRDELDAIEARALGNKRNLAASPWTTDKERMQLKTILRRACRTLPQNSRLSAATELDERAELGIAQDLHVLVDPEAVAPAAEAPPAAAAPKAPRKSKAPEPAPEPENGPEPELSEADAPAAPPPAPAPEPPPAATPAPMAVTTEQMGTLFALARKLNGEKGAGSAIALLGKVTGKQSAAKLTAAEADAAINAFEEALGA